MTKSFLLPGLVATIVANSYGELINFLGKHAYSGASNLVSYTNKMVNLNDRGIWYDTNMEAFDYAPNGDDLLGVTLTAGPSGSVLSFDTRGWVDGFGVKNDTHSSTPSNGTVDSEIDGVERFEITFDKEIFVQTINLTNLYYEATSTGDAYNEVGYYKVNDGSWVAFSADNSAVAGTNGNKVLDLNVNVTSLLFKASENTNGMYHDFSVANITYAKAVTPVPEPSTFALFGLAMLSFVGYRRFRKH